VPDAENRNGFRAFCTFDVGGEKTLETRASTGQSLSVTHATATPRPPPDERLDTDRAFDRFVARVSPRVPRWLAWEGVPEPDRDDVSQELFCAAHQKRATYDPARGRWEDWAYGFAIRCASEYRRRTGRRARREELLDELPVIGTGHPGECYMMVRLLYKCLEELPDDLAAILLAFEVDGRSVRAIATAHGISQSTVRNHLDDARDRLQRALDRELFAKRSAGLAVIPITLAQLFDSERKIDDAPESTVRRLLERLNGGRASFGPRALRALLGPRGRSALTHAITAASAAGVTYAIMRHRGAEPHNDTTLDATATAVSFEAPVSTPSEVPMSSAQGAPAEPAEHASVDGGAPEHDGVSSDTSLYERGYAAYRSGRLDLAVETFREHERRFPRSRYRVTRERFWTFALITLGRTAEAHKRIEQLRRANPDSPLLKEFDAALPPEP
jgi:RNA polymerase sigma factor (sigma-70 family)